MGGLFYFQGKQAARKEFEQKESERIHNEQISLIQAAAERDRDSAARERRERHKTDSLNKVSENALKSQIRVRDKKLTELRVPVASLIDSVADLSQFVAAYDSSLASRDSLIVMLTQNNQSISESYEREIKDLNSQVAQLEAGQVAQLERVADLERSLEKATKKANKRLSFGIGGGYSVTQYDSKLVTGPSITGGVFYRIFSF